MLSLRQLVANAKHAVAEQTPEDQKISQGNLLLSNIANVVKSLHPSPDAFTAVTINAGEGWG